MLAAAEEQASTISKGHGRIEKRTLRTTTVLNDYLDWPGVRQVFCLRRERTVNGRTAVEEVHGITSLPRERAKATRLLELVRGHWGIENRLHYVRDVTLGEDACRVRKGVAPAVLAGIRNAALVLLSTLKLASFAEAIRACALRPRRAIRLLLHSG